MHTFVVIIAMLWAGSSYAYNELKSCFIKPQMHAGALADIYELSTKCLMPHIIDVLLVENEDLVGSLPYVLGFSDGSLLASKGDEIFAKGISNNRYTSFSFVTAYQKVSDPLTGKSLGIQLELAGYAELLALGEVQRLIVKDSFEPIAIGFRLVPRKALNLPSTLYGVKPDKSMHGVIIGMHNYQTMGGNPGVISVNLGVKDGLKVGDVLDVYAQSKFVLDPYLKKPVKLPGMKRANVVIYKTTPRVSLGLVVEGFGDIDKFDEVVSFGDKA